MALVAVSAATTSTMKACMVSGWNVHQAQSFNWFIAISFAMCLKRSLNGNKLHLKKEANPMTQQLSTKITTETCKQTMWEGMRGTAKVELGRQVNSSTYCYRFWSSFFFYCLSCVFCPLLFLEWRALEKVSEHDFDFMVVDRVHLTDL